MRIMPEMKVKDALKVNEKMLDAFIWLAPEFERLRHERLRRAMSGRVTVEQAARIARVPVTEVLYLLNIAAGENEEKLSIELNLRPKDEYEYRETNPPSKPAELRGVLDTDRRVRFVDVTEQAELKQDPLPKIARGLVLLKNPDDVLLVRHPFDPIPLRDLFARKRGLASWAEEREPNDWYIYFYQPGARAAVIAHPPLMYKAYAFASGLV